MKRVIAIAVAAAACAAALPAAACADDARRNSKYTITAAYDGANTVTGRVKLDYVNEGDDAPETLEFNLWGNAWREGALFPAVGEGNDAFYDGTSYGRMEITAVEGGQWRICGEDENILEVDTGAIYPGESASVEIEFTLTLANADARTGVAERAVNLGNFYPVLCASGPHGWIEHTHAAAGDPFVSDVADYEVSLSVPEEYVIAASGEFEGETVQNGTKTCTYTLANARDFAAVLSKEYSVKSLVSDGGTAVEYYCYNDEGADELLEIAAKALDFFEEKFAPYPHSRYVMAQTGLCEGGMEYPALAMISDELEKNDALYAAVHEAAHQWWYAAVGSDGYENAWQDEGLAEYSALMFFESAPEYGITRTGLLNSATKAYRAYFSVYGQLFGGADTSMARPLDGFAGEYEYVNIAYNKGLLLFEAVRQACGDEKFCAALKSYAEEYSGRIAPPEGLIAAFAGVPGCEGIFDSFLTGKVII